MPAGRLLLHSSGFQFLWAVLFALIAASLPLPALAHPMGNFSTNRYSQLTIGARQVDLLYVLDMAEIPTHRAHIEMDLDGDKIISDDESKAYAATLATLIASGLELIVDGHHLSLLLQQQALSFQPGQGGLETLRLELVFAAMLPVARGERVLRYTDSTFDGYIGWQELVITPGDKVQLVASDAPAAGSSNALRTYPEDLLQSPLAMRSAEATFVVGGEGNWQEVGALALILPPAQPINRDGKAADPFANLIIIPELGPWALFMALLAAFGWGALHAMSPGHGKSIVGAYLIGARGTVQHAIFLGLATTITHTLGVFGLGFVALAASQFFMPEQLYPWLGAFSGLMVAAIGYDRLRVLWRPSHHHSTHSRHTDESHAHHHTDESYAHHHTHGPHAHETLEHHHDHEHLHDAQTQDVPAHHLPPHSLYFHDHGDGHPHSHLPPERDGAPVTWRSLLVLGVSGGLMPCPSALVVMLGAIALGRIAFGLVLITVFSLGLASVLTAIGIALVHAGKIFERIPEHVHVIKWLPIASALFITGAGLVIAIKALASTGLFSL